jgi:hypothetical protein
LYNYGPTGFNNNYPNWNQGNSYQYYTGGTGSGLSNTGYVWYRGLRNVPFQGRAGENPEGIPVEMNPPMPMGKSALNQAPIK